MPLSARTGEPKRKLADEGIRAPGSTATLTENGNRELATMNGGTPFALEHLRHE